MKADQGTSRRLAAALRASRQGPTAGKLAGTTREGPRQGTYRGKAATQNPAHPAMCHPRATPGARGGALRNHAEQGGKRS